MKPGDVRPVWRISSGRAGHCPGERCYVFVRDPRSDPAFPQDRSDRMHVPAHWFWGTAR